MKRLLVPYGKLEVCQYNGLLYLKRSKKNSVPFPEANIAPKSMSHFAPDAQHHLLLLLCHCGD